MGAFNSSAAKAELENLKANTNLGMYTTGIAAKDILVPNTPRDGSNALLLGDKVIFPSEADFDANYFVLQPTPTAAQKARGQKPNATAGVMCTIERGDKTLSIPVYAATFNRRVLLYSEEKDEQGNYIAKGKFTEDAACDWPGKGIDASQKDVNAALMFTDERTSMYKAFRQFAGKTLEVKNRRDPQTLGFSNSEYNEDGSRKRVLKTQKVLDIMVAA